MTSAYVSAEGGNANGIASGMVSVARCVRCDAARTQGNACSAALRLRARNALQRTCIVRMLFARLAADRARQTPLGGWRLSVACPGVAIFHWASSPGIGAQTAQGGHDLSQEAILPTAVPLAADMPW